MGGGLFSFCRLPGCLDRLIKVSRLDRNLSMPVSHSQQTGSLLFRKMKKKTLLVSRFFLLAFWMLGLSPPHWKATERNVVVVSGGAVPSQRWEAVWSHHTVRMGEGDVFHGPACMVNMGAHVVAPRGCCLLVLL